MVVAEDDERRRRTVWTVRYSMVDLSANRPNPVRGSFGPVPQRVSDVGRGDDDLHSAVVDLTSPVPR